MTAASTTAPPVRKRAALSRTTQALVRWRGMGAMLVVAFYSLFFAAHLRFQGSPIYVNDGVFFGARTQTVFNDLIMDRKGEHRGVSAAHPAFTLLHQPVVFAFSKAWELLRQSTNSARKHGVASLTCLVAALTVVMVYHSLLWGGVASLRAILLAVIYGSGTCAWIMAPLPETWIFSGLGLALLAAVAAKGYLAPWWLNLLAAVYAMSCFVGNAVPVLIFALARCAQDTAQNGRFTARPLLVALAAATLTFGLANAQRMLYPLSQPLPTSLAEVKEAFKPRWEARPETPALIVRETLLSNIVAPVTVTTQDVKGRATVTLAPLDWTKLGLHQGVAAAWLLLLVLAMAGLFSGGKLEPLHLALMCILVWSVAALPWYGSEQGLLLNACLWTPVVVVLTGLGLERILVRWSALTVPLVFLLAAFVAALITRNWAFLQDVAGARG